MAERQAWIRRSSATNSPFADSHAKFDQDFRLSPQLFAKAYAKAHGLSATEVIDGYLHHMRALEEGTILPELETITGLIPADIDAESAHQRYLGEKHR